MNHNGVIRCSLCRDAVEVGALSGHLHSHSTWALLRWCYNRWPAFTVGLVLTLLLGGLILYAAITEALP